MTGSQSEHAGAVCGCVVCAARHDFEMPPQLVEAFLEGDLVVFAGAGVSTETPLVFPYTLYEDVAAELGIDVADGGPPFPELMAAYERTHDRMRLLAKIRERLEYVRSFPEIDRAASWFHRELATAYTITDIFTTNWDEYFERECLATPFLTEADWAFWKSSERKVFKLHGSIANPGSLIATADDYERCYAQLSEGLVGATLQTMLATKTVVFVGYSFGDSDFNALYDLFRRRMGNLLPKAYVVTLDEREPPEIAQRMHVVRTDARHFVEELKKHYPESEFVPDDRFEAGSLMREIVREVHHWMLDELDAKDCPEVIYAASYHDGVLHALDHQDANRASGRYSHRCWVERQIEIYERLGQERLAEERYIDVAYVAGYRDGLLLLLADDEQRAEMPMFFVFGHEGPLGTPQEFLEAVRDAASLHPEAHRHAAEIAARLEPGVVLQHTPFLL